ncbi:DUF6396 domain-containing protein [Acinetobacter gerneri]|uniref:DUF6396 domain-containing protein n=1 Tax=Acinetobacter gerneri TaxID=202952 RepID=UPI0023F0617C|nr:DUF6396 domain-containing protein [Acinetobacter gerneri]MCH4243023.1 DUF6396 domain-containing protein [Acinetobacter gerneri]
MKIRYLILVFIIALLIFFGFKAKRFIDCDLDLEGGAPGGSKPAYCTAKEKEAKQQQDKKMVDQFKQNITFQCKKEARPELSVETQEFYNYAYYHDLHNMWNPQDGVWDKLVHYYRIAAANGDYKANVRLQYLLEEGKVNSPDAIQEAMDLNKALEKQLPATAYYKTYTAINDGHVETEQDGQFAFLRKAAELGSPEAQFELSKVIMQIQDEPTRTARLAFADELVKCSSENGYGEGSLFYGMELRDQKKMKEAQQAFYLGVKQGSSENAYKLDIGFKFKSPENQFGEVYNLGLDYDKERSRRFEVISDYLGKNDYLNPKVPDLDEIVPLPPAKLPAWDGKIAFQRWYEGPSPEKPSDELVEKLAKAKGLDPKTGLPLKK